MKWFWESIVYLMEPLVTVFRIAPVSSIGVFSALLPIVIGWRAWRRLAPPVRWAVIYLTVTFVEEIFMLYWSRSGRSNIWVINLFTPVAAILLGLMFAGWQQRERWRTVIYAGTAAFPVFWLIMMMTVEDIRKFPPYSQPVQSLLVLSVATWTLVQRSRHTVSPLTRHPWFWVSIGVLFYFVYLVLLDPFSTLMMKSSPHLVLIAFEINGALVMLMNLFWLRAIVIARGTTKAEGYA
jgi:hypothetical protein